MSNCRNILTTRLGVTLIISFSLAFITLGCSSQTRKASNQSPIPELSAVGCHLGKQRADGIQALVSTILYVDARGNVLKVEVQDVQVTPKKYNEKTLKQGFGDCASKVLMETRFTPYVAHGQARPSIFYFDVKLHKRASQN